MKDPRPVKKWWPLLVVWGLLVLPLVSASVWSHRNDHFAPVFDLAMTEVRVRDVGTVHTPLVGLPGRLGQPEIGSHPGPLSFYLLAPVYRLLGGSYWALRVSTATFNALAIAAALIVARRCAGAAAVIGAGFGIACLELGFGLLVLTEPWNPYLPVLWFPAFLLAAWSVAKGDVQMLPIALATGSVCAQTHVPYAAVCGGIGVFAFSWVVVCGIRAKHRSTQWDHARSCLLAVAVVAALWAPPIVDECIHHPGNLSVLFRYFAHPPTASLGLRSAAPLVLAHLDAWHFVVDSFAKPSVLSIFMQVEQPSAGRGSMFLALWVAAALTSVKLGNRSLLALHGAVATALVVMWLSISRIMGEPWNYLLFSAWGVGVLLLLATVSTAGLVVWNSVPERWRTRTPFAQALGVTVIGVYAVRLATQADRAGSSTPSATLQLAALAPPVADAIRGRVGAATGVQGRYLVTWQDALYGGGQGLGLVNELERRGLRAGVSREYGRLMVEHRILEPREATARVHLATGGWIYDARRLPGAVRVAYSDSRSAPAREEFMRLRADVVAELRALGRKDVIKVLDRNLGAAIVPGVSPFLGLAVGRMSEIGVPAAVFIVPAR